ncbi:MAG: hypothetical protein HY904_00020 [Deltaproteobacteria bacterium]|nr:hypothetical protein [Deltaproteobacteria bacterium]
MKRAAAWMGWLAALAALACLPRSNPFDRDDVEDAYGTYVTYEDTGAGGDATEAVGEVTLHFTRLPGRGIKGYRVYREDTSGARVLVAELGPKQDHYTDPSVAAVAEETEEALEDGTLWWRVSAFTQGGEGELSRKHDRASTRILPDTRIDPPVPAYVSGVSGVAVIIQVTPSALEGAPPARLYRYRFRGGQWTDPILAGPLVLTGLQDGRYTLEVAAVDDNGDADLTPARATFIYDFNVPEGTTCEPAVCNPGLFCVGEPVGNFCRRQCAPATDGGVPDGGATTDCPLGTSCRMGSGRDGLGACVAVAQLDERCDERLCVDGLACGDTGDQRALCGTPCPASGCAAEQVCAPGGACLTLARQNEACTTAACASGLACDDTDANPRCRRACETSLNCGAGESCEDLGRDDLKVCR